MTFETLDVQGHPVPFMIACSAADARQLALFNEAYRGTTRLEYPPHPEGQAVTAHRLRLGLSLGQAGERLGLSPQVLNDVEHGRKVFVQAGDYARAAELLGVVPSPVSPPEGRLAALDVELDHAKPGEPRARPPYVITDRTEAMPCAPGAWGSPARCLHHEGLPLDPDGKCVVGGGKPQQWVELDGDAHGERTNGGTS
jgi:transcriptional regulator with XRE-family HTH domain